MLSLSAGQADFALVVGVEKLTHPDHKVSREVFDNAVNLDALGPPEIGTGSGSIFMDTYAGKTSQYMASTGATREDFAQIVQLFGIRNSDRIYTGLSLTHGNPQDADNPLRFIIGVGMPKQLWREFETRFGVEILEFYGCAEDGLYFNPPGAGTRGKHRKTASEKPLERILSQAFGKFSPNVLAF